MVHCFRYELWTQNSVKRKSSLLSTIDIKAIALAKTQNFKNKRLFFCKIVPLLTHLAASSVSAAPTSSLVSAWWWWWGSPALSSRLASATACTSASYWIPASSIFKFYWACGNGKITRDLVTWMTLQLVSVFTSTLSSGLESPLAGAEV